MDSEGVVENKNNHGSDMMKFKCFSDNTSIRNENKLKTISLSCRVFHDNAISNIKK